MPRIQVASFAVLGTLAACTTGPSRGSDTAFAAMQERGKMAMGVDQYTSTHEFDDLADGGRIALVRDASDTLGVRQIRAHLRLIQHAFEAGDFSTPEFVHMRAMPGTDEMTAKRDAITFAYRDLPNGGELRIASQDAAAVTAIHAFMAAQRGDHHAGGMTMAGEH